VNGEKYEHMLHQHRIVLDCTGVNYIDNFVRTFKEPLNLVSLFFVTVRPIVFNTCSKQSRAPLVHKQIGILSNYLDLEYSQLLLFGQYNSFAIVQPYF